MKLSMRTVIGMELEDRDFQGMGFDEMKSMIRQKGLSENTTKYRITTKKDGKFYLIPASASGISISLQQFIRSHGELWTMIDKVRGKRGTQIAGAKAIIFYDSNRSYRGRKKFVSHRDNYLEIKSWVESGNFIKLPLGLSKDLNSIINYFEGKV